MQQQGAGTGMVRDGYPRGRSGTLEVGVELDRRGEGTLEVEGGQGTLEVVGAQGRTRYPRGRRYPRKGAE